MYTNSTTIPDRETKHIHYKKHITQCSAEETIRNVQLKYHENINCNYDDKNTDMIHLYVSKLFGCLFIIRPTAREAWIPGFHEETPQSRP